MLKELHFPHSVGLLYSAFTYYTGFMVNSGEYKLMGLAPYGNAGSPQVEEFKRKIVEELVDIRKDGSILLNMDYFSYPTGLRMVFEDKWERLFGVPRRQSESDISQPYMDMALAIQEVTEEIVMKLCRTALELTKSKHLALVTALAILGGTLERIAVEIRHLQRTEVGEAFEPFGAGQQGSSAVPHKRNPILAERVSGLVRLLRPTPWSASRTWRSGTSATSATAPPSDSPSSGRSGWRRTRRAPWPTCSMASRWTPSGCATTSIGWAAWYSEAVLLAMVAKGADRQAAYRLVQGAARRAWADHESFADALRSDPAVGEWLTAEEIDRAMDLRHHLAGIDVTYRALGLEPEA